MNKIQALATKYSKSVGDDCLCQRTNPGTPVGEHIFIFCGCDVSDAYKAGFKKAKELALLLDPACQKWFEVPVRLLKELGEEEV